MGDVRIPSGSISRAYLSDHKLTRDKFDKDFAHIDESERDIAWNATHEPTAIPKQNSQSKDKLNPVD